MDEEIREIIIRELEHRGYNVDDTCDGVFVENPATDEKVVITIR